MAENPHSLVTEDLVKKVLLEDQGKEAQLLSWKVVSFTKLGDNYACDVSNVRATYSKNGREGEASYVAKLNPCRGLDVNRVMTNTLFVKEMKFYLELLPELNEVLASINEESLHFPKCFHGSCEMGREQLYLEDLRERGFKMFDRKKGMDAVHATFLVKELARLHAASLLLQHKYAEPLAVKHDYLLMDCRDVFIPILDENLKTNVQMLEKVKGYDKAAKYVDTLRSQLPDLYTTGMRNGKYDVVCHGDCWNNNILFRYNSKGEPLELMLLDLQICRIASPATDLNYFMYASLTGDVRGPNLSSFLSSYYNSFKTILDSAGTAMPFTEEDLLKEFRAKNPLGCLFSIMTMSVLLMEPDEVPDMVALNNDPEELMKVMRAKAMSELETNPMVKTRFLAIFDEFMETGLIS